MLFPLRTQCLQEAEEEKREPFQQEQEQQEQKVEEEGSALLTAFFAPVEKNRDYNVIW